MYSIFISFSICIITLIACAKENKPTINKGQKSNPVTESKYISEIGEFETTTALKLRKGPSIKTGLLKCSNLDLNICPYEEECTGSREVLPKGTIIKTVQRTGDKEFISGKEGYWYQLEKNCNAWVFGGFLTSNLQNKDLSSLLGPFGPDDAIDVEDKCKEKKMKLASKAQVLAAYKKGLIKKDDEKGFTEEAWYRTPSGGINLVDLATGNDLIAGKAYVRFFCTN